MNKKRVVSTLVAAGLLLCCAGNTLAYEETDYYMPQQYDMTQETTEVQTEPEALSYTTLPTYYGMESMTNAMLACTFWSGRALKAGETIDFINTMSRENAYEGMVDAPAITTVDLYGNPVVENSFGGGICATAVALGNAADDVYIVASGVEHTQRSAYIRPEDRDFTVAEGVCEMYLTNYTNFDYTISMWMNADTSITAALTKITPAEVLYE